MCVPTTTQGSGDVVMNYVNINNMNLIQERGWIGEMSRTPGRHMQGDCHKLLFEEWHYFVRTEARKMACMELRV